MSTDFARIREYIRNIIYPGMDTLILFVTSRCNCRCSHCFYWRELNNPEELSLKDLELVSKSSGNIRSLMLSGGEPFLRNDLPEIAGLFISNANVRNFSIPTNGSFPGRITAQVEEMSHSFPLTLFTINVSLDSFSEVHDGLRVTQGIFDQAMHTIKNLISLRSRTLNLKVNVTTVISHENLAHMEDFVTFVNDMNVDAHNIEIIRGDAKDPVLNQKREELVDDFIRFCWKTNMNSGPRKGFMKRIIRPNFENIAGFFQKANRFHQSLMKYEFLSEKKAWAVRCRAGENICVVEPDGQVRACELRTPVCSLKDFNYNLMRALGCDLFLKERNQIRRTGCSCTHGCFLSVSCRLSVAETLIKAPFNYIRRSLKHAYR